jgi:hypothetical protein
MSVLIDLLARELLFVVLLAALGAGPASWLSSRWDAGARAAIAPALGLCVGVCLTVTLIYWFPARETSWAVIAAAIISVALGVWHRPPARRRPRGRTVLALVFLVVVVVGSFNYPLVIRGTVGPVGGFQVGDTGGYVAETDGFARYSIRQAAGLKAPFADLAIAELNGYVSHTQQLDVSALEANVNRLLGLGATDTQSAFLIAILLTGALAAFALVRSVRNESTWAALLAGCLFAGPFFVQLFMEGSQAAIAGAAALTALVAVGWDALRERTAANLILTGLAAAGLQTIYPLYVPGLAIGAVITLAVLGLRAWRGRRLGARGLRRAALALGAVILLAVILTPVAFSRNAHYWLDILSGKFNLGGPAYNLPTAALPGWLLQTRDFYGLVNLATDATAGQLLLGAAVPVVLLAVTALAVWREPIVRGVLAVAFGASLLAFYTWNSKHCAYCVQRNLLPVGVLAPAAFGAGLALLAASRAGLGRAAAALIAVLAIVVVGHEALIERQRLTHGDYMLDQGNRRALAALPKRAGPLELEGFSESDRAPMEMALVYNLADERSGGDLSYPTIADDGAGLAYLTYSAGPIGPSFKTNYQYVLTRLAGVATARRTIARFGSIALQRRTTPLDVTAIGGLSVAPARLDPGGTAWVNPAEPLSFLVVGGAVGQPAWVSLGLAATVPVTVAPGPGVVSSRRHGDRLTICLRATGNPPLRAAAVQTRFTSVAPPASPNHYDDPLPSRGLRLLSMRVSTRSCASR